LNCSARIRQSEPAGYSADLPEQTMSEMQSYYDDRTERWRERCAAEDFLERTNQLQEFIG